MKKTILLFAIISACWLPPAGFAQEEKETGAPPEIPEGSPCWQAVENACEEAKAAGEHVPGDIQEWIRQDLAKTGGWEYMLAEFDLIKTEDLEQKINALGRRNWECFWVERSRIRTTLFFKRPARSSLRDLLPPEIRSLFTPAAPSASAEPEKTE